jgi:hypothetical protein
MEMLLVITAIGALSAMGAVLIGLLMSAESRGTEGAVVQSTFSRLGRQLRADAHAAVSANVVVTGDIVDARLDLHAADGRSIRYVADEGQIVREADRENDHPSRERYLLPEGTSRFVVDPAAQLVRVEHLRPFATESETGVGRVQPVPRRVLQIEAALDWDRRHQTRQGGGADAAR